MAEELATSVLFGGYTFDFAGQIDAERDEHGSVVEYFPYRRFDAARGLPLLPFGDGPHAKLKVSRLPDAPGAYVIADRESSALYVGIATKSLRQRWSGVNYCAISPRNCYRGGQATNVRINFHVGRALAAGAKVYLWIHEAPDPKPVEIAVFAQSKPPWTLRV